MTARCQRSKWFRNEFPRLCWSRFVLAIRNKSRTDSRCLTDFINSKRPKISQKVPTWTSSHDVHDHERVTCFNTALYEVSTGTTQVIRHKEKTKRSTGASSSAKIISKTWPTSNYCQVPSLFVNTPRKKSARGKRAAGGEVTGKESIAII